MVKKIILPFLGGLVLSALGGTLRLKADRRTPHEELEKKFGRVIYAFWHGRLLLLIYLYRDLDIGVMISDSKDGELVARITNYFGFLTPRGSSTRGGARGLIELKKEIENGHSAAFAVDGPQGPRYKVKEGIIFLASRLGYPIIPLTTSAAPALSVNSWDRFMVPLPFSRGAVLTGNPVFVAKGDDFQKKTTELENEMNRITELADNLVIK